VFNSCIELLTDFRKKHMEIAIRYITMQAPKGVEAKGTGGTNITQMLGAARQQTREHRI
jgi:indoleamine 2,3-dioxygenase